MSQLIFGLIATSFAINAAAQQQPEPLLQQISDAMHTLDYRGTLVRSVDGKLHTLRVAHRNQDGVSTEKLVTLDGEQREIVRVGNELICLWPQRRLKFVDKTASPSNAFARLPAVAQKIGRYYELVALGKDRVAGRDALRYFIRPKDAFRYGHSLWVDAETLLPLRMQLLNAKQVVEEIRFTDVTIGADIDDSDLLSTIDDTDFELVQAGVTTVDRLVSSSAALRARTENGETLANDFGSQSGFSLSGTNGQMVEVNGRKVQRFEYSDGIATVSVFVAAGSGAPGGKHGKMGATHSYQRSNGNSTMTLVGEVPLATLRMLAEQADRQLSSMDQTESVATE
ncbi:MAG: MucB/RseB C-terminal domain-containing protein [Pseudomonadota bacterium]